MAATVAVAAGALVGTSIAAASGGDPGPNPAEDHALAMADGVELVEEDGMVCVVTRSGKAGGSSCTSTRAEDVMLAVTRTGSGYILGVFDPRGRATAVEVDGQASVAARSASGRRYFHTSGSQLPETLRVVDGRGNEIQVFTPAQDQRAEEAAGHDSPGH